MRRTALIHNGTHRFFRAVAGTPNAMTESWDAIGTARHGISAILLFPFCFASSALAAEYEFSWGHPLPQGNLLGGTAFESVNVGYAVGARGSVVRTTDGGTSWVLLEQFPDLTTDFEDLLILAPGELLAVGASPGIFRSMDSGSTWEPVTNPSTGRLVDLEFLPSAALSAVGDDGQVLRSSDGGAHWTLLTSPGGDLAEQYWSDDQNGYVVGTFRAQRTTDGGATWTTLPGVADSDRFNDVFFTDSTHGYMTSDGKWWKTTNGGASWQGDFSAPFMAYAGNVMVLSPQHFLTVTNLEGALVLESTDAGETWELQFLSGAGGFLDFDRLADGTLIIVSSEGDIYRSTDDGATWTNTIHALEPSRQTIGALMVGSSGRGAAGSSGTPGLQWYSTTDGGNRWDPDPDGPAIAFTREIAYWDADRAVAVGDVGRIWRTTDGGINWLPVEIPGAPSNGRAWHVSLPAPGVAFAGLSGQTQTIIYRTTDWGVSWHPRSSGFPLSNSGVTAISFISATEGFAAGYVASVGRMYKTTDGGGQWTQMTTAGLPSGWIWDLHWHDAQTAVGTIYLNPGGIYRTTNGGANWTQVFSTPAYDISFSDPLHGVAGNSDFVNPGEVFVTDDGGATWETVLLPATDSGQAVAAIPGGFLAGGPAGKIVKATRLDASSAPDHVDGTTADGLSGPTDRLQALSSVGTRFEIVFELIAPGRAELAVFDLQGRRVATLAEGTYSASSPVSVSWRGSRARGGRAPAGVYFVRLRTDDASRAIKIVLTE